MSIHEERICCDLLSRSLVAVVVVAVLSKVVVVVAVAVFVVVVLVVVVVAVAIVVIDVVMFFVQGLCLLASELRVHLCDKQTEL